MKIDSSTIGMESARSYQATKATYRHFSIMEYRQGALTSENELLNAEGNAGYEGKTEAEDESQETESADNKLYTLEDWQNSLSIKSGRVNIRNAGTDNIVEDLRQVTIRYIFDMLFASRRNRLNEWMEKNGISTGAESTPAGSNTWSGSVQSGTARLQNFAASMTTIRVFNYTEESVEFEQEDTGFSTVGTVRTSDGREISFNVDIGMSRQFQQTFRQDLELASFTMCDPLVINLDTDVAELSDQKFYFDIDADGEQDRISGLGSGSGYLALDKNDDGVINDGSELFGTQSGDGFADLARYDEDGNGWIDENDAIWSKLKIWCKDENGNDVLYRLQDKGVGAICLQKAATDFTLKGADGQTNGAIRSTGVFLYENGDVGTLQHVDVAKYERDI